MDPVQNTKPRFNRKFWPLNWYIIIFRSSFTSIKIAVGAVCVKFVCKPCLKNYRKPQVRVREAFTTIKCKNVKARHPKQISNIFPLPNLSTQFQNADLTPFQVKRYRADAARGAHPHLPSSSRGRPPGVRHKNDLLFNLKLIHRCNLAPSDVVRRDWIVICNLSAELSMDFRSFSVVLSRSALSSSCGRNIREGEE